MRRKRFAWASLPDEQLLKLRFRDLKVTVEGTWLEDCLIILTTNLNSGVSACGRMPGFQANGSARKIRPASRFRSI